MTHQNQMRALGGMGICVILAVGFFYMQFTNKSTQNGSSEVILEEETGKQFVQNRCLEMRKAGGFYPGKFRFERGVKYGDFLFEKSDDRDQCVTVYYFIGTTTISGTYGMNEIVRDHFSPVLKDLIKMPHMEDFWTSGQIDDLLIPDQLAELLSSGEAQYENIGTSTIIVANPVLFEVFIEGDAYQPYFTILKVISNSR